MGSPGLTVCSRRSSRGPHTPDSIWCHLGNHNILIQFDYPKAVSFLWSILEISWNFYIYFYILTFKLSKVFSNKRTILCLSAKKKGWRINLYYCKTLFEYSEGKFFVCVHFVITEINLFIIETGSLV